jgi:hypothetical protein
MSKILDSNQKEKLVNNIDFLIRYVSLPIVNSVMSYYSQDEDVRRNNHTLNTIMSFIKKLHFVKYYLQMAIEISDNQSETAIGKTIFELEAINDGCFYDSDIYDKFKAYHFDVVINELKSLFELNTINPYIELPEFNSKVKVYDIYKNFTTISNLMYRSLKITHLTTEDCESELIDRIHRQILRISVNP